MKSIYLAIVVVTLAACATNKSAPSSDMSSVEVAGAIRAFEDVCLKTAPTFSKAGNAVVSFGITDLVDAGFMKTGFNKDQSLGVQIKEGKECVITTPPQRINTLTKQFLQAVSRYSSTVPLNRVPTKATIKGETFIFLHDRKGGEAFVMLRAND